MRINKYMLYTVAVGMKMIIMILTRMMKGQDGKDDEDAAQ